MKQRVALGQAAHEALATHTEQQVHLLKRAQKAEWAREMAVPELPVALYHELAPQRRGPAPVEPRTGKTSEHRRGSDLRTVTERSGE
jgi:hypothetical protein